MKKAPIFLFLCGLSLLHANEHPLASWTPLGPLPTTNEIRDLEEHGERFLAAASLPGGEVLESVDGLDYVRAGIGLPEEARIDYLTSFNETLFAGGLGKLYRQNADESWQEVDLSVSKLEVVNDELWAWRPGFSTGRGRDRVWTEAEIYRSTNGETWQDVTITENPTARIGVSQIFFEHGQYYLVNPLIIPFVPEHGLYRSQDGTSWEPVPESGQYLRNTVRGEGRLIVAASPTGNLRYTDDGENWQSTEFKYVSHYISSGFGPGSPQYSVPQSMAYAGGRFHALVSSQYRTMVVSSNDGSAWPEEFGSDPGNRLVVNHTVKRLASINDQLFLIGEDGEVWLANHEAGETKQLLPYTPWNWHTVATNNERLIVAGEAGQFAWSDDGFTFNYDALPAERPVNDSVWVPEFNSFFIAGGSSEKADLWKSPDGADWEAVPFDAFSSAIKGLVWDGSQLWLCGNKGQLARSSDGENFNLVDLGDSVDYNAIDFGNNRLVITASGGKVIHSLNGQNWNTYQLGPDHVSYQHATFGNGVWMISDGFEAHLTSDFETWWERGAQANEDDVLFAFGNFITSNQRYIVTSPDGSYWETQVDALYGNDDYPAGGGFEHGVRFQDRVVFVGDRGLIGMSEPWRDFFAEWQDEKFSESQLADEAISGADSDPDQDGWSNAFEYAFDLDPLAEETIGQASLYYGHTDRRGGFDSVHGYTGILGAYSYPWTRCRPGVITWAERTGKGDGSWVRHDIISDRSWGGNDRRDSMTHSVMIPPGQSNLIRLRAKIVRP